MCDRLRAKTRERSDSQTVFRELTSEQNQKYKARIEGSGIEKGRKGMMIVNDDYAILRLFLV